MTKKVLCIYHGNCQDGFGAAWAVRAALGEENVDFYPATHGNPPPDVTDRDVVIVDFSYKRDVLLEMALKAISILVLDHHESAQRDLEGLPPPISSTGWDKHLNDVHGRAQAGLSPLLLRALFDMERSGAGMAWDFFNPDKSRPTLIDYIEDRDLWRFHLAATKAVTAAVFSYPYDFAVWDELAKTSILQLTKEGEPILRKQQRDVKELVAVTRRKMVIGGCVVPVCNLPYTYASDAAHLLCKPLDEGLHGLWVPDFAACYWDTPDGRVFSLRSVPGGANVSEIAVRYGGGGHKHAAGFRMPVGWEGDDDGRMA